MPGTDAGQGKHQLIKHIEQKTLDKKCCDNLPSKTRKHTLVERFFPMKTLNQEAEQHFDVNVILINSCHLSGRLSSQ
jgi:hypothetical protein